METFHATTVSDTEIVLADSKDLERLSETISDEENFILSWIEEGVKKSKVMIGNNINSKVINGDIILSAQEVKK